MIRPPQMGYALLRGVAYAKYPQKRALVVYNLSLWIDLDLDFAYLYLASLYILKMKSLILNQNLLMHTLAAIEAR